MRGDLLDRTFTFALRTLPLVRHAAEQWQGLGAWATVSPEWCEHWCECEGKPTTPLSERDFVLKCENARERGGRDGVLVGPVPG